MSARFYVCKLLSIHNRNEFFFSLSLSIARIRMCARVWLGFWLAIDRSNKHSVIQNGFFSLGIRKMSSNHLTPTNSQINTHSHVRIHRLSARWDDEKLRIKCLNEELLNSFTPSIHHHSHTHRTWRWMLVGVILLSLFSPLYIYLRLIRIHNSIFVWEISICKVLCMWWVPGCPHHIECIYCCYHRHFSILSSKHQSLDFQVGSLLFRFFCTRLKRSDYHYIFGTNNELRDDLNTKILGIGTWISSSFTASQSFSRIHRHH